MDKKADVLMGFAEIDITPTDPTLCELVGFFRPDNRARGILHRLMVQVMVFQCGAGLCCLVTIDSIGFTTELTNRLRDSVALKLGVKRESVMVCFSHTHSAPDAAANDGAYFEFVAGRINTCLDTACADLTPVKAAWGIAKNTIGVNRRMDSDTMENRLGVLKISDAIANQTKVLLLRVTAHPNVLTSDNFQISPDYFGVTRELLEDKYGCKVMIIQGASGNIKPKFRQENADFIECNPVEAAKVIIDEQTAKRYYNQSIESLSKMAEQVARAVDVIYDKLDTVAIDRMVMFSEIHTFYADVPTIEQAHDIAAEARSEAGMDGSNWLLEVRRLHEEGIRSQEQMKEVQFFVINNGCFCGMADEPMCEIALDIQKRAADDFIFFNGYTNGYEGYLANATEYDKGGYEVLWSNLMLYQHYKRVMPLNRDTADKLAELVSGRWRAILDQTN